MILLTLVSALLVGMILYFGLTDPVKATGTGRGIVSGWRRNWRN